MLAFLQVASFFKWDAACFLFLMVSVTTTSRCTVNVLEGDSGAVFFGKIKISLKTLVNNDSYWNGFSNFANCNIV